MGILGKIVAEAFKVGFLYQLFLLCLLSNCLVFGLVCFLLCCGLLLPDYLLLLYNWIDFNRSYTLDNRYYFYWRRLFNLIVIQDVYNFLPDFLLDDLVHYFLHCLDLYVASLFLELSECIPKILQELYLLLWLDIFISLDLIDESCEVLCEVWLY